MSNGPAGRAVRSAAAAVTELSQRRRLSNLKPGEYERVFFVAGEMRSGTSWLRRTLSAHPQVTCGHEGSFFGRGYDREEIPVYGAPVSSLVRVLGNSEDFDTWHGLPWNQWADGREEDLKNLVRLSVDYFLAKEVARTGKLIVGDKSPQHTENVDEIHEFFPDARVLHIARDGRDVAVSAMHHWWRLSRDRGGVFELEPEELEKRDAYLRDSKGFLKNGGSIFTEERLAQLARRWSRRVGKADRDGNKLYGGAYLEVRYEDLIREPVENLQRIFELLGARSGRSEVERCIEASSFERTSNRRPGEEDPESFFRKGVAGDWRSVFTARDREIYEGIAGEQLAGLGYEIPGSGSPGGELPAG